MNIYIYRYTNCPTPDKIGPLSETNKNSPMFSGGPEEDTGLPPEAIVLGHGTAVDGRNGKQPFGM